MRWWPYRPDLCAELGISKVVLSVRGEMGLPDPPTYLEKDTPLLPVPVLFAVRMIQVQGGDYGLCWVLRQYRDTPDMTDKAWLDSLEAELRSWFAIAEGEKGLASWHCNMARHSTLPKDVDISWSAYWKYKLVGKDLVHPAVDEVFDGGRSYFMSEHWGENMGWSKPKPIQSISQALTGYPGLVWPEV
jgi:hypothetical protein